MGLAFFKLSLGMGTMMTYGSYFRDDQNIPQTTVRVMIADLFVSMLAGIAIFPAVFTFGFAPSAGPSLVFITIPAVFSQIPGGHFLMVVFFVLAAVAATGAMLSLMEVPVVILHERLGLSRAKSTLLTIAVLMLFGFLWAGWSLLSLSLISGWLFLGNLFAQHLVHKTLLACLAWIVFSVLLWGRHHLGWRGHKAIRWTLAGFCLLMLAYFGSKLVREYILHI